MDNVIMRELARVLPADLVDRVYQGVLDGLSTGRLILDKYDGATFISAIKSPDLLSVMLFPHEFDRKMITAMKQYIADHRVFVLEAATHDIRMARILMRLGFQHTTTTDEGYIMTKDCDHVWELH